jgi:DNA-binding transcriptional LysR family regulator
MHALARDAPGLHCELVEAEPEDSLPALALGDVDLVLADEWEHQPLRRPPGVDRHDLHREPVRVVLPVDHPLVQAHPGGAPVPLRALRDAVWACGHAGAAWPDMVERTCRSLGGFDPEIRHRTNDAVVTLALVAGGFAVTLLPDFVGAAEHPGVVVRDLAEGTTHRTILAATRTADAARPSVRALLAAVRAVATELGWSAR